jgi:hypothetical protein
MPPFKEVKIKSKLGTPDKKGTVVIKIILIDEKKGEAAWGNRKEQIALEDTTVGEVYDYIRGILLKGS